MLTTFLTRAEVARHMQALHLLKELREAFAHAGEAQTGVVAFSSPAAGPSTMQHASLPSIPAYSVTVRAAGARVVLQLHDQATGKLLALMDGAHLTGVRAAVMGALAADVFAREDATTVAILGKGSAASGALKALRLVRSISRAWLYEPDLAASFELSMRLQQSTSMAVSSAATAEEAVAEADIVVLTGEVSSPASSLRPGTHVTVLAAETFEAAPLTASVREGARVFCDVKAPAVGWAAPHATLAQVLAQSHPGRTSASEVTIFSSMAPAFLDLVAAWHVLEGARSDDSLARFDLEA
jgi:ornithine cyclodeaminase